MEPQITSLVPSAEPSSLVDEDPTPGVIVPVSAVAAEDRPGTTERPWLFGNMVSSLDGGTAIGGVSGPLGGAADFAVFRGIRASADAILVGASTVIEEQYRPPQTAPDTLAARRAAGREDRAEIAVVTRSLNLPIDLPLFSDPTYRPVILTVKSAPTEQRAALEAVADVVNAGEEDVDMSAALKALGTRGHRTVLSEGGPTINGQLIAADLFDEWNLSLSPMLAAGGSKRPAVGPELSSEPERYELARLWTGEGLLFGRWIRPRTD